MLVARKITNQESAVGCQGMSGARSLFERMRPTGTTESSGTYRRGRGGKNERKFSSEQKCTKKGFHSFSALQTGLNQVTSFT